MAGEVFGSLLSPAVRLDLPPEPIDRVAQFRESQGKPLATLLAEFHEVRTANLFKVRTRHLTDADLDRTGTHPKFGTVTLRLFVLSARAPDAFGRLALVGMAVWIGVQTCTSMMMVNGTLPPIGIPLPFVSYGGSSLLALWMGVGLSMTMSAQAKTKKEVEQPAAGSYGWRDRRPRVSRT